jgi:dTDP-4-amino-4,6-dideoxygalactose transaminase
VATLAIAGGTPLRSAPFTAWPVIGEAESRALDRVLHSGTWGTLGPEVTRFARRYAEYCRCRYGVAVANGTVSLEVILRGLGIGRGDEVIIPPYTFIATASAVISVGATPVFVDIRPDTYCIDPLLVEQAVTPRTRAVIPVHVGGRMADMTALMEVAARHSLHVVEDAAHAHGSEWKGQRAGSIGSAGSFSFQGSKNLNAGEGGFITTNDQGIYEQCWSVHHCGRAARGTAWYEHPLPGTNARMTEWQAAILDAQMDRLDAQIATRMANARYLDERLREIPFIDVPPADPAVTRNSYHLYVFRFASERCRGLTRERFVAALAAEGIPSSAGYNGLHTQELFVTEAMQKMTGSTIDYRAVRLPVTEKAAGSEGMWLLHWLLLGGRRDVDDIADAMIKIHQHVDEAR